MKIVILLLIKQILLFGLIRSDVSILQGDQYISVGQDRFLNCELDEIDEEDVEKVEWTKDRKKIEHGGRFNIDELELTISKIEASDAGSYKCQVTAEGQTYDSYPVTFTLYEKIKFENCEGSKLFEKGTSEAELECQAASVPAAKFSWSHQGKTIKKKDKKLHVDGNRLKIQDVDLSDSGMYYFVAKQSKMGIKESFAINVTIHDPVKMETRGSQVDVKEGEATSIHCKASGVPTPTYSFLNGTDKVSKLDDNEKFSVEFKDGESILHIKEAEAAFTGEVICKAHNDYSEQHVTFSLNVLEAPKIESFENVTSKENEKLELTCNVRANPPVIIEIGKVSKENNKEIDMFKQRSSTETNSFTFFYQESSLLFDGAYYCKTIGNKNLNFPDARATNFVEVLYQPIIEAEKNIKEVKTWVNNAVELVCVVKANPKPTITWKTLDYNGVEVTKDFGDNHDANMNASEHLSGYSSESEDNYYRSYIKVIPRETDQIVRDFVCTASNAQGVVTETFQVLEAFVPKAPEIVGIEDLTATSFVVVIGEFDDGGTPVLAYEATYYEEENRIESTKTVNFTAATDKKLKIDNLTQKTSYIVAVRAINGVGVGEASATNATTKDRAVPTKVILLESKKVCQQKNNLEVRWTEPYSSGLPIENYEVYYKLQKGINASNADKINISEWVRKDTKDNFIHLRDLEQSSKYEVFVLAQNIVGLSKDKHIRTFHTCKEEHVVLYVGAVKPFYGTHTGSSTPLYSTTSIIFISIMSSFLLW